MLDILSWHVTTTALSENLFELVSVEMAARAFVHMICIVLVSA